MVFFDKTKVKEKALGLVRSKYVIASFAFLCWMLFFDQNNWLERSRNKQTLNRLKQDKAYYIERIQIDNQRLHELKTNNENLEKFAREQYLMKKSKEDIFIVQEKR